MDPKTIEFVAFCVFSVLCLLGGYLGRRSGTIDVKWSPRLHFAALVFFWSIVGLLSLWKLPLAPQVLWLLLLEPVLIAVPAFLAIPLAKWAGCNRKQVGVVASAAGLGNLGFTLGAYLCYTLLTDPARLVPSELLADGQATAGRAGDVALSYAVTQVMIMANAAIVIVFPIARHFGHDGYDDVPSIPRLVLASVWDIRALSLYASIAGIALSFFQVPFPAFVDDYRVLTVLFFVGGFASYFGIGLRLEAGALTEHPMAHVVVAVMKFGLIPLLTGGLILIASLTPGPPTQLNQTVMIVLAFCPAAIQVVIIANLFHLDARFAGSVWLINTIAFLVVPMPILIMVFR